jgi:hypothetical protein
MSMLVWELRFRDGRLRARFRSGKWQFSNRLPGHLGYYGKPFFVLSPLSPVALRDPLDSSSTQLKY